MNANSNPQDLWKQDDARLPEPFAMTEICSLARQRERENIWARRIGLMALGGLAVAFVHNAWTIEQPLVRAGAGWMGVVMIGFLWSLLRDRSGQRASSEPCAGFLLRALARKRDGYRMARRIVLLIMPALLASWWGGGAALRARAMGLSAASPYYGYLTSVWPIVATCVLLLAVWFAFGAAAKRAAVEFEALERRIGAV